MKLLFDENLSPKLISRLSDIFPNSIHVREVGLESADDPQVWDYAKDNDFMIVSKDYRYARFEFGIRQSAKSDLDKAWKLLNFASRKPFKKRV